MSCNILVIPDPHASPETDSSRFTWLGNLVVAKKPDVIVCLGDWAEMNSLSSYNIGGTSAEGQRYAKDINAANEALRLFEEPITAYNMRQRESKKKLYFPEKHMIYGNHEMRINITREKMPKFADTIDLNDLLFPTYGWKTHEMTKGVIVERIKFTHFFTSGVMGKPIGGANHARNLLLKNHVSSVCGHSHLIDYSVDINALGESIFGLVAGCYFDYDMDWTTESDRYWRGVIYLHDASNGSCFPEFLGIRHIRENYS